MSKKRTHPIESDEQKLLRIGYTKEQIDDMHEQLHLRYLIEKEFIGDRYVQPDGSSFNFAMIKYIGCEKACAWAVIANKITYPICALNWRPREDDWWGDRRPFFFCNNDYYAFVPVKTIHSRTHIPIHRIKQYILEFMDTNWLCRKRLIGKIFPGVRAYGYRFGRQE